MYKSKQLSKFVKNTSGSDSLVTFRGSVLGDGDTPQLRLLSEEKKEKKVPKSNYVKIAVEDLNILIQFGAICAAGYNNRKNDCKQMGDFLGERNYGSKAKLAFDLLARVKKFIREQGYTIDDRRMNI